MAVVTCEACGWAAPSGAFFACQECGAVLGPASSSDPSEEGADEHLQLNDGAAHVRGRADLASGLTGGHEATRHEPVSRWRLVAGDGLTFEVGPGEVRVGRDEEWATTSGLDERDRISRRHASFWQDDGQLYVRDEGSTNGTQINGRPCPSHQARQLSDGDTVRMSGDLLVRVVRVADS